MIKESLLTLSGMCMFSSICCLMMHSNSYLHTIRMVLGMEIIRVVLQLLCRHIPF